MNLSNYLITFFASSICTGIFLVFIMLHGFHSVHNAREVIIYVIFIGLLNIDAILFYKITKKADEMAKIRR